MGDDRVEKNDIRVLKAKDVADNVRAVLQGNEDMSEIETSLHRIQSRYNKSSFAEREVFNLILESNLVLARTVRKLTGRIEQLEQAQRC